MIDQTIYLPGRWIIVLVSVAVWILGVGMGISLVTRAGSGVGSGLVGVLACIVVSAYAWFSIWRVAQIALTIDGRGLTVRNARASVFVAWTEMREVRARSAPGVLRASVVSHGGAEVTLGVLSARTGPQTARTERVVACLNDELMRRTARAG